MNRKPFHRVAFLIVAVILLLTIIPSSCQRVSKVVRTSQSDNVNWADSADKMVKQVLHYYNNDLHDSLVIAVEATMNLCREHQLWHEYYRTWMKLGEEYTCTGQPDSALAEAQKMHSEAMNQGNDYGMMIADYIKALGYSAQRNPRECARLLDVVLNRCKGMDEPHFLNKIYAYFVNELKQLDDNQAMKEALGEWKLSLDSLVRNNTDTVKVSKDNLTSFHYMYQRSCYFYYYNKKEYREAAKAVDSIEYYNQMMGWTDVARNEVLLDRIMLAKAQGHYEEALRLNDEQLSKLQNTNYSNYNNALITRHQIFAGLGRWREAYELLQECNNLSDTLRARESSEQLNELNKRFEVDELKLQAERERMESERNQLYLVIAFILLAVLGGALFGYHRFRSAKCIAKLKSEQDRIEGELMIARNIQMSMVPSTFPEYEGLDMYASMTPAKEVGGDLYGYVINGSQLYFAVGDVSGKGVPASLFMAQATRLFHTMANQGMEPVEICSRMNNELSGEDNVNNMFVTMFIGMLDLQTGHLAFCNAGHNPPVLGGGERKGDFLKMISNVPIGMWPDYVYKGEEIESVKGRALFFYTDGLNEAENLELEQFGNERLLKILRDTHFDTARQVVDTLEAEVEKHRNGAEPNDDMTMMCLRVK